MLIVMIIFGLISVGVIDLKLRTKFNVPKNEKFLDQYVTIWHFFLEAFMCVLFMMYVTANIVEQKAIYTLLLAFIMFLFIVRGSLEYLFRKNYRRHIISFTYAVLCGVFSGAIALLL
ncbi:MAG: DUF4181 domain-containing protein [Solibacillus sp.]